MGSEKKTNFCKIYIIGFLGVGERNERENMWKKKIAKCLSACLRTKSERMREKRELDVDCAANAYRVYRL